MMEAIAWPEAFPRKVYTCRESRVQGPARAPTGADVRVKRGPTPQERSRSPRSAPSGNLESTMKKNHSSQDGRSLRRKHPGTGTNDTSSFVWAALKAEYIRGDEPLTDIAGRYDVIYSAAHNRMSRERWNDLLPPPAPPAPLPAAPSRPACPSCGAGSRAIAILETAWAFECSGCKRTWEGPAPLVNHGGRKGPSPCCQRRTTVVDRVLHEIGLQTLWHERAGCGMVWRERVDFRGDDRTPKISPWVSEHGDVASSQYRPGAAHLRVIDGGKLEQKSPR